MSVCLFWQAVTPGLVLPHTLGRVLRGRTDPYNTIVKVWASQKNRDYYEKTNNAYKTANATSHENKFPELLSLCHRVRSNAIKYSCTFWKEFTWSNYICQSSCCELRVNQHPLENKQNLSLITSTEQLNAS